MRSSPTTSGRPWRGCRSSPRVSISMPRWAVVADESITPFDVLDLVGLLVEKSLLFADESGRLVRYRMLETIRQYGAERLDEAGERAATAHRHREHFRSLLRRASAEEEGPDQLEWRARVIADIDNIRAALQSALQQDDGAALIELTTGVGNTMTLLGVSGEHYGWLREAIARAPADSPFRASAIYQLGIAEQFRGELSEAREHLEASVPLYRELGDENGALWAYAEYCVDVRVAGRPRGRAAAVRAGHR